MLILSRKKGQKLIINDNIEIVVIEADNNIAKIGINAPKDVSVYREELYKEIQSTNKNSTNTQLDALKALEIELPKVKDGSAKIQFTIKKHNNEKE
ncbi:MAG: carbon storage regulator CsrA [Candidatus Gastranaerophilales bacterium]|nr:carbon storage regulator CsrA [Candidatus Gastranaerophilales bacterium]